MSVVCPNGHTSASTDYCDICGSPITSTSGLGTVVGGAGGASGAGASGGGSAHPQTTAVPVGGHSCPNCSFPAAVDALFCENCGYDFTTGSLPEADPAPLLPPSLGQPVVPSASASPAPADPFSATEKLDIEAAAAAATPPAGASVPPGEPTPLTPPAPATAPDPAPAAAPAAGVDPGAPTELIAAAPSAATPAPLSEPPTAAQPPLGDTWVAEVWVDPEWYESQHADDPLPSGGLPAIVVLRQRSVLVGRYSASRNIVPQIDCGTDSGVSRRHAQLNTDGQRWWVEDLQSSNGTYLSPAGGELPTTPLIPGQRREVGDGDRIFLGGWTRLVIRKALPGEV